MTLEWGVTLTVETLTWTPDVSQPEAFLEIHRVSAVFEASAKVFYV